MTRVVEIRHQVGSYFKTRFSIWQKGASCGSKFETLFIFENSLQPELSEKNVFENILGNLLLNF